MAAGGAFGAQPEGTERDLEVVHDDEQIARGIELGIGAQRGERGAAVVHVGRRFEDGRADAGDVTAGNARALAAPK